MAQEREIKGEIYRYIREEFSDLNEQDSSVRRIADWLAAPLFADTLQVFQEHRIENTAQWIFQKGPYRKWLLTEVAMEQNMKWKAMPPWVLWVHGKYECLLPASASDIELSRNPGCGKTMMASSVYNMLAEEKSSKHNVPMVCYFFFKHTDPHSSNIEAAYRSALSQILYQYRDDSEMLDKFLFIQSHSGSSTG